MIQLWKGILIQLQFWKGYQFGLQTVDVQYCVLQIFVSLLLVQV